MEDTSSRTLRLVLAGVSEQDAQHLEQEMLRCGYSPTLRAIREEVDLGPLLAEQWDAVVTDIASSAPSPAEVRGQLLAADSDVPMLVLAATDDDPEALALMRRGAKDVVARDRLGRLPAAIERERGATETARAFRERSSTLRERERRHASLLTSLYDVYYQSTLDGTLIDISPSVRQRGGYEPEELLGHNVREVYAEPADRDKVMALLSKRGVVEDLPLDFVAKDGTIKHALLSARVELDEQGQPETVVGALRDVTERHRMEQAIRASEERYRLLVESAGDPIFTLDREGRLLFVNGVAAGYFGRRPEEMVGTAMAEWFPEEMAARQAENVRLAIDTGIGATYESPVSIQGEERWFSSDIRPIREAGGEIRSAQVIARDMTAAKLAETRLRNTEQMYRTLAKNFPNGAVFLYDRNLRFTLAEGTGLATVGPTRESLIGRTPCEVFPAELCRILEPAYRRALNGQSARLLVPLEAHEYEVQVVPVRGEGGAIELGMVMTQDVTARQRAQEERERLIKELQDALASIRTLRGLIPICSSCKKVRNDRGYWQQVEEYVHEHSEATFSHGLCGDCARKLYPEFIDK